MAPGPITGPRTPDAAKHSRGNEGLGFRSSPAEPSLSTAPRHPAPQGAGHVQGAPNEGLKQLLHRWEEAGHPFPPAEGRYPLAAWLTCARHPASSLHCSPPCP